MSLSTHVLDATTGKPAAGVHRLVFDVDGPFYPEIAVSFRVGDPAEHYHVPILLSPFAYSTYLGS